MSSVPLRETESRSGGMELLSAINVSLREDGHFYLWLEAFTPVCRIS